MKKLTALILALLMALALAACGGDAATTTPPPSKAPSTEPSTQPADTPQPDGGDEPQTLTVWCWDPSFNIYAMKEAEKIYQQDHPNFSLNIVEVSNSDIEVNLTTLVSSGALDQLPDIFLNQNNSFQKLVISFPELFSDLTGSVIPFDQFAQSYVGLSTVEGRHYGVPFDNSAAIFGLRTDILADSGFTVADFTDITWADYITKATTVKEKTGKALLSGQAGSTDMILVMLQSAGASLFNADGTPNIANNAALKSTISVYSDLVKKGLFIEVNSWDEFIGSFVTGNVGGVIIGCWGVGSIQTAEDQAGKWDITNLPKLDLPGATNYSAWGGSSWAVSGTANKELATDFLAATFGGSTALYDAILPASGAIANYLPAADSAVYKEPQPFFGNQPIFSRIADFAGRVPSVNTGLYYYEARDAVSVAVQNIMNGADIDTELKAAEDTVKFAMGN